MNWWVERIASAEEYSADKRRILRQWTLGDVADAHRTLDFHAERAEEQKPDDDNPDPS